MDGATVTVPASSANLGAGFDALGMALTVRATIGLETGALPERAELVGDGHPAAVAFARAGGRGRLWVRSPIPAGRGLGFSGTMRVGGVVAAHLQRHGGEVPIPRAELLSIAAELEGHPDNAAASMYGGVIAAAAGRVVRIPVALRPAMVIWVPDTTATSTDHSRRGLPDQVPLADAAFNIGRATLLVAALAAGDAEALRAATEDRLHQDRRFAAVPGSAAAWRAALGGPAWAAWLSGSGPSVAVMCDPADVAEVIAGLPADGHCKTLAIDARGAQIEPVDC